MTTVANSYAVKPHASSAFPLLTPCARRKIVCRARIPYVAVTRGAGVHGSPAYRLDRGRKLQEGILGHRSVSRARANRLNRALRTGGREGKRKRVRGPVLLWCQARVRGCSRGVAPTWDELPCS
eukprot:1507958-Pyramimonas_sp.AAC.1